MNILVSNDDGVYAPGLKILYDSLLELGNVTVVAPDRNRSGVSNSLTLHRPLHVKQIENGFYSVEGTPTDCVHLALSGLLKQSFDIVVSGINSGANLGDDVIYSGTVAAATEGRFLGLPAIAISLAGEGHFHTAGIVANKLVQHLTKMVLPVHTILNVNVPNLPWAMLNGFMVTRLGTRHAAEPTIRQVDPRGHEIFWIGPPGIEEDAGEGTDFYAIKDNCVSLTPLNLDLSNHSAIPTVKKWLDTFSKEDTDNN